MNKKVAVSLSIALALFLVINISLSIRYFSSIVSTPTESTSKLESAPNVLGVQVKLNSLHEISATVPEVKKPEEPKFTPKKIVEMPVLMYHHINNLDWIPPTDAVGIGLRVSPEIFEKQLQQIQERKFNTVTSTDLYEYIQGKKQLPENPIMLTFDDGYKDNYTKALPLLKKYNMKGDFAVITGFVGQNDYMTWDEVRDLKKQGMDISSHSVHHCYLAVKKKDSKTDFAESPVKDGDSEECPEFNSGKQLNTAEIKGELLHSKQELEKQISAPVYAIVYPFGNYNQQVEDISREIGYQFGFTVKPQNSTKDVNFDSPFDIGRTRINGQQTGNLIGFFEVK